jgi:N-acetylmuramoyl-L-alanine amidase
MRENLSDGVIFFMRGIPKRIIVWLNWGGALKIILTGLLVMFMIYLLSYELPSTKTWTYWTMPLSGKVIALDAGHGGPDGGAISKEGVIEKDITLAISLYLRDYLQQAGAVVVMTREHDTDLANPGTKGMSRRKTEDLLSRVDYIQKKKSDYAVTIHLNSIPSPKWYGAQTFYYPRNDQHRRFAALVQDELKTTLKNTDREALTKKDVYLLKALPIPSVLVEVGFLSNPDEARRLADEKYQKKLAEAIYRGILRYTSGEKAPPAAS